MEVVFSLLSYLGLYTAPQSVFYDYMDLLISYANLLLDTFPICMLGFYKYPPPTFAELMDVLIFTINFVFDQIDGRILIMTMLGFYALYLTLEFSDNGGDRITVIKLVLSCMMKPIGLLLFISMMCVFVNWPNDCMDCFHRTVLVLSIPGNIWVAWSLLKVGIRQIRNCIFRKQLAIKRRRSAPALCESHCENCYGGNVAINRPYPDVNKGSLSRDSNPANVPPRSQAGPQEPVLTDEMDINPDQKPAEARRQKWLSIGRASIRAAVPLLFACLSMVAPRQAPIVAHIFIGGCVLHPLTIKDNENTVMSGLLDRVRAASLAVRRSVPRDCRMPSSVFPSSKTNMHEADTSSVPVTKFKGETAV